jgi:putative nucleotidyltransferase with HDIG domain
MEQKVIAPEKIRHAVRAFISRKIRSGDLTIPVLPHVAQKILSVIHDPNISVEDISVDKDQQVSARVVKIANSPVYSRGFEIKSIKKAVLTVGLKVLHELVFSIAVGEKVFCSKLFDQRMKGLWEHSLTVGLFAKQIAHMKSLSTGYGFLCGLMHDVGKPIILVSIEELHEQFKGALVLSEALVDDILFDYHQEVGNLMASSWDFPSALSDAIRYHHNYSKAEESSKAAHLVYVSGLFAANMGNPGYVTYETTDPLSNKAVDILQFTEDEMEMLTNEYPDKIREILTTFQS